MMSLEFRISQASSCADFYNETDRQPLNWQQLRRKTSFVINDNKIISNCTADDSPSKAPFYIYWQAGKVNKYVEWRQDYKQQRDDDNGGLNRIDICYINDRFDNALYAEEESVFPTINAIFGDCLLNYGKIPASHTSTQTDAKTSNRNQTIIKPGSRPSSMFDYDPSVSCEDNPYPPQCDHWRKQFVSCMNFYNQSDGKLLWWQTLRQEVNFYPSQIRVDHQLYYNHNCNECKNKNNILAQFYINDRNNAMMKKYDVAWHINGPLFEKNPYNPDDPNVCFCYNQTKFSSEEDISNSIFLFEECLLFYGKLAELVLNYPTKNT